MLSASRPSAPIVRDGKLMMASTGEAVRKPLRPRKERPPVATAVDPAQVRRPRIRTGASAPVRAPAPPQPAAATFAGGQDNSASIPPDTAGAVGPHNVFNPLNNNVTVLDRSGAVLSTFTLDAFWAHLGLGAQTFDPRVVYDPHDGRFVFATMANAMESNSSLYLAVSTSDDATKPWVGEAIQVDDTAQGPVWLDYPSVGFSADKVTVQVNLYTRAGNRFAGSTIYVFDKNSLYDPSAPQRLFQRFVLRNQGATHVPAVTYDTGVNDQYLLARWAGDVQGEGYLDAYRISGNPAIGAATITRLGFIASGGHTWDSFAPGDIAPQKGVSGMIDTGDDRLLSVCLRNGLLYCSHTALLPAGGATRSAAQWWEIEVATSSLRHFGRIDDPSGKVFHAFATLAVNASDDLFLGMAQFSAAMHASAVYVYRPNGGAPQAAQIFAPGRDTYIKTFGGHANRWGDYSATMVDPENDRDFWAVQEYAETPANTWGTMWVHFIAPSSI